MVVQSTGKVGINETTPTDDLHIAASASGKGILLKTTGDTHPSLNFDANRTSTESANGTIRGYWNGTNVAQIALSGGSDTTNKDDGIIQFFTSAADDLTERMRIDISGNLGIGTASPGCKLEVYRTGSGTCTKFGKDSIHGEFTVDGERVGFIGNRSSDNKKSGFYIENPANTGTSNFEALTFRTVNDERMRIDSSGNVGVGTITPEDLLHLQSGSSGASSVGAAQLVLESSGSANWVHFKNPNTQNAGLMWSDADATEKAVIMYNHNTDDMEIKADYDIYVKTADTERMRITSNAGILLSNGILVERCKVHSSSWGGSAAIDLDDGNVHLNTAAISGGATTWLITSDNTLAVDLGVGDMTSLTLITLTDNTAKYGNAITIDGSSATISWVGGSAPTDGGGSGYDVYTFNIIKTGANAYVVIGNQVKGS